MENKSDGSEGCFAMLFFLAAFSILIYLGHFMPKTVAVGKVRKSIDPFNTHVYTVQEVKNGWVKYSDENGIIHSGYQFGFWWMTQEP